MKKFRCIRDCYFKERFWAIGKIYEGKEANEHFEEISTNQKPDFTEGTARKRGRPQKMSMQAPAAGVETETVKFGESEMKIQKVGE